MPPRQKRRERPRAADGRKMQTADENAGGAAISTGKHKRRVFARAIGLLSGGNRAILKRIGMRAAAAGPRTNQEREL